MRSRKHRASRLSAHFCHNHRERRAEKRTIAVPRQTSKISAHAAHDRRTLTLTPQILDTVVKDQIDQIVKAPQGSLQFPPSQTFYSHHGIHQFLELENGLLFVGVVMTWRSLFVMMAAAAAHCCLYAARYLLSNTVRTVIKSLTLTLLDNEHRLVDRFSWSKQEQRKGSEKKISKKRKVEKDRETRPKIRAALFRNLSSRRRGHNSLASLSTAKHRTSCFLLYWTGPPVSCCIGLLPFQTTDWYVNRCYSSCVLRYATLRLRLPATLLNSVALAGIAVGLHWDLFCIKSAPVSILGDSTLL